MINKRLIREMSHSKKYIGYNVVFQWICLLANVAAIFTIGLLLQDLYEGNTVNLLLTTSIIIGAIAVRFICNLFAAKMSYLASAQVKSSLREKIYRKLLRQGSSYNEHVSTSEVVQVSVEGVEQLEIYFGRYLPQLVYSLLAPITLFVILSFISIKAALVLLICVPLIPMSIIAVQKIAKKLLHQYWGIT
ncbi:ABC transporter transmembrane domain-containing protein [Paenibacillus sp. N1-5-1-14]|uniref:ABC transporter transmembrane domain-containing protein n=1 Tax=Paenibacillus radicibacter TaxID=2972488 RepID=UPI002158CCED|nr:ABC transporter transmembrane domain-containing protein [Paenibacillus radicibacter]MCR8644400.1 ABC transporter transmembrane domain-containing protein [Paenibacillus radicibacter]